MRKLLLALSFLATTSYAYDHDEWDVPSFPGEYMIQSVHSGLCLDIEGASLNENANVQQYRCKASGNQRFKIITLIFDDALYVSFKNVKSGRSLAIDHGTQDSRSENVVQKMNTVYTNEEVVLWRLVPTIGDAMMIKSFDWEAGCLDVKKASLEQKGNIQVFDECHGESNQLFRLIPVFD